MESETLRMSEEIGRGLALPEFSAEGFLVGLRNGTSESGRATLT
jgi:hypothetical protein